MKFRLDRDLKDFVFWAAVIFLMAAWALKHWG